MNISVIIVHWNTPQSLAKLLDLLRGSELQVIVVDNHSSESLESVIHKNPEVIFIKNSVNKGFAAACNQGVLKAEGEWLLFLNPDIELTEKEIHVLIKEAEDNKLDAASPLLGDGYQKPVPSLLSLLAEFSPLHYLISLKNFKHRTLAGGCLLIKRHVLLDIGGWDERFFLWFEDSDLTKRLLDGNFKIGFIDKKISHKGGESFERLENRQRRDMFFYAMDIYARKYFKGLSYWTINKIVKRYTEYRILPLISYKGISLVIPNLKKPLLENFLNKNYTTKATSEWIVVTSGLSTQELWDFRRNYPDIRFVHIDTNLGFAHTVNIGLRVATYTWVGTVNDDTYLHHHWDENLTKDIPFDTGSINPVIKKEDGSIESAGVEVFPKGKASPVTRIKHENSIYETDATNAAAVLYSKEALFDVGLFDEQFGSYLEDIDLALRIKKFGWKNIVNTQVAITHLGHSTSSAWKTKKAWLDFKNWILLIYKNWSLNQKLQYAIPIAIERTRNLSGIIKTLRR
jgi:GT2 family glycosyltransferase